MPEFCQILPESHCPLPPVVTFVCGLPLCPGAGNPFLRVNISPGQPGGLQCIGTRWTRGGAPVYWRGPGGQPAPLKKGEGGPGFFRRKGRQKPGVPIAQKSPPSSSTLGWNKVGFVFIVQISEKNILKKRDEIFLEICFNRWEHFFPPPARLKKKPSLRFRKKNLN